MSKVTDLLVTLTPAQQAAIKLIKLSLDCFNSADGTGLFSGLTRYATLAGRCELAAVQAGNSLVKFWAVLLRSMRWPTPPKRVDPDILDAISCGDDAAVLRVLATETQSVLMLARMLHDADKATRREYHAALRAEADMPGPSVKEPDRPAGSPPGFFNDPLPL